MKQAWIFLLCTTVLLSMNGCIFTTTSYIGTSILGTTELSSPGFLDGLERKKKIKENLVVFIGQNSANVKKEIAAGSGRHLNALIKILMIDGADSFKIKLQKNFDKIYPTESESHESVAKRIYNLAY